MSTFIAFLRGINVSGKNMLPMAKLKVSLENSGFQNVRTYIQSGNIIFQSKIKNERELSQKIGELIKKDFDISVPVIIRNPAEITDILGYKPFRDLPAEAVEKMHVTMLSEIPEEEKIEKIDKGKYLPDMFSVFNREVYLYCPGGYGNTKLNNTFFESKLKVTATTRNLRTMKELLRLSSE